VRQILPSLAERQVINKSDFEVVSYVVLTNGLLTAAVVLILGLSGSFIYLVKLSLVGRVSVYAATCAVLPLFRRRKDIPEASFRVPAGSTVAYACIVALALCLSRSSISELLDVVAALTVGLGIFGLTRFARRSPVPGNP